MKVTEHGVSDRVILVDEHDVAVGTCDKFEAHVTGVRHRAVSVVVFRADNAVLMQQRAAEKYHSPGLWSNSCCGHPRPGESPLDAARRRLIEEMGVDCALEFVATLAYRADVGAGLVEHEIDHLFVGRSDAVPSPAPSEVAAWRWVDADALLADLAARPSQYTVWCGLVLRAVLGRAATSADRVDLPAGA